MQKYDIELTRRTAEAVRVPVIASGGAARWSISLKRSPPAKPRRLSLLFHDGVLDIPQLKTYLSAAGAAVRRGCSYERRTPFRRPGLDPGHRARQPNGEVLMLAWMQTPNRWH